MGDTSPYTGEALNAEVEEIASVQVLFPDRRTLDEVIAELRKEIEMLKGGASQSEE
jgi:hypothetical protein